MKILKKIVLITMVLLMLSTLKVYAVDYPDTPILVDAEVTMTPSSTTVKAGDTVTITISAKYEKGVEGVDATLEYDKTKLEMTGLEPLNYYLSFSDTNGNDAAGGFQFSVMYGDFGAPVETPKEAEIAIISFKVLDTVVDKEEIMVKLSGIEIIDPDVNDITAEDEQTILTVIGEQKPEGDNPEGGNPEGDNPEGVNPEGGNPEGGNPESGKPEGENPEGGNPEGGNPEEGNPEEGKPEGETPKGEEPKDPTIADKPMYDAGVKTFGLIAILMVILVFVLYRKCQKYKGVK